MPSLDDLLTAAVDGVGGATRPGQVEMAHAVEQAIESGEHLLVQAGTGTGKSLAYLVPAIRHAVESGRTVVAKAGRYGPYVTEVLTAEEAELKGKAKVKPRTASLFKDMDLATIELDTALRLLSLPRVVGTVTEKVTAEDGTESEQQVEITAQNGRYGPYLKKGTDSRSLTSEQQLFDITLAEAEAIYAQPKQRGRAAAKPPLREFDVDPESGKKVVVKDGRFGPYVTDGETNATLRRDDEPETITQERAFELLAEKRAKGPTTRKKAAKKTAKKAAKKTAKKAATKKATARTTTKKAAAKKS